MNKKIISAALASIIGLALAPSASMATDGTINITGTVNANTCTVSNTSNGNIDVVLPSVSASALAANGDVAGRTAFNIALSGCTATSASTFFEPGAHTASNGNLDLDGTSTASGVQVQLLNGDQSVIDVSAPEGSQNSESVNISNQTATLNYYAQYYAQGTVAAGSVSSSVTFTMIYN